MTGSSHSKPESFSPPWHPMTKLVVGLTLVALALAVVIYFRRFLAPLLLASILSYFLYPVCRWVDRHLPFSWRTSVTLVYIMLVLLLISALVGLGFALVQQVVDIYYALQQFVMGEIPILARQLSDEPLSVGPLTVDLRYLNWNALASDFINTINPLLTQAGRLVTQLATRTLSILGWLFFVIVVSYFIVSESTRAQMTLLPMNVPMYSEDLRRLKKTLGAIWHAFLRGQLISFTIGFVISAVVLTVFGVPYSLGMALLVGIARFLPYIGPLFAYVLITMVIFFQPTYAWGLEPWQQALIVVLLLIVMDQTLDNVVLPRLFGSILGVHPAAVLVMALWALDFIGLVGVMIAAPLVATLKEILRYLIYKLFDLDPWPDASNQATMEGGLSEADKIEEMPPPT